MKPSFFMKLMKSGLFMLFCWFSVSALAGTCQGRFINPITDVCWSCLFPLTLGSMPLYSGNTPDTENPSNPFCLCTKGLIPQVGTAMGFWEPARVIDVTRTPYCFVTLGGTTLNLPSEMKEGDIGLNADTMEHSFYNVHFMIYPLLSWLGIAKDTLCIEKRKYGVMYLSELDPTWNNEALAVLVNPEAKIFANSLSQAACAADCVSASAHLPNDDLSWCAGCQGSMYPLTGSVGSHVSDVQASVLIAERATYKLHRLGREEGTMGSKALCGPYDMPLMKKSQYRLQMVYPKALTSNSKGCNPYGRNTLLWESGVASPLGSGDFGYLIFRKRNCCVL